MKLSGLLNGIAAIPPGTDMEISGVETRAQEVRHGHLFLAIKGFSADGHDYIQTALDNGAAAVVAQYNPLCLDRVIIVDNSRRPPGLLPPDFMVIPPKNFSSQE